MLTGILDSSNSRARWPEPLLLAQRPVLLDRLASSSVERWHAQANQLLRIITWPGDTTDRETRPVLTKLTPEEEKRRVLGKAIYNATCYSCHNSNGRGKPDQVPPLADSDWVNGKPDRLVRIVLQGLHGPIEVNGQKWNLTMPALGQSPLLNDERLAGLLTYIRRAWDNYGDPVATELIDSIRQATAGRTASWSVEELLNPQQATSDSQVAPADPLAPYRPALTQGDAERGRKLFHTNLKVRCSACHKVGRLGGGFVGPDLTEVGKRLAPEQLLESLIVPSAKIAKGYETLLVITDSSLVHSGILKSENDREIVLALPDGGTATLLLDEIEERIPAGISTMPQMASSFSVEEIADLVAYLKSLQSATSER
jgi:putative heme-binding domain-containing protein